MAFPTLTAPPTAPSRSDPPATFITRADAMVAWFATCISELGLWQAEAVLVGSAVNFSSTSTTSLTVGTGTKSLTVDAGRAYQIGQFVVIASTASPTNYMFGQVTSYNSTTGALVVEVSSTNGSGTIASWTVSLAPVQNSLLLTGGTLTGSLNGTTATFSGALSASTGSFSGALTAPTVTATISSGSISPINGVSGLGALPSASFTNNGSGSTVLGATSSITSDGNNTSSYHYAGVTQSVAAWYLYGNGTTSYTSDERVKTNIKPARTNYLADIMALQVVKFDRRLPEDIDLDNPGPRQVHGPGDPEPGEIGLIAQDVAAVFPAVVEDAIHNLDGTLGEGTRSKVLKAEVIYGPILLAAFQELVTYTQGLEARLAALEAA